MRSQREAYQHEIALEAEELRDDPEAEAEELALIYRAKGLDPCEAGRIAATIMKDQDPALDTMAREELGLDPDELGSPWSAAFSSLIAFALGAIVVVLPYLPAGTRLLKTRVISVEDFIAMVEPIAAGASIVDPSLVQELIMAHRRRDPLDALSPREREVLALMAEGGSNAGIARRIFVSEGTVEKHVPSPAS